MSGITGESHFGISSIQELQLAIFAKTKGSNLIGKPLDAETINEEWASLIKTGAKNAAAQLRGLLKALPYGKGITVGLEALAPHLIGSTLICLDDFERLSDRLPADELLGFVSSLKEEKKCKIALIFNEERLGEKGEAVYKKYREKLIDIELLFAPTPAEAADLVFQAPAPWHEQLLKLTESLTISNIRLLRKIERLASLIFAVIAHSHEKVRYQAAHTLVLVAWLYFEPDAKRKPSIDFLRRFNSFSMAFERAAKKEKGEQPNAEASQQIEWEKLLDDYGFKHMDELDLAIMKVVERGYVEESGLEEAANKLDEHRKAEDLEQSSSRAWDLFHNTFANNEQELVAALHESFKKFVRHITPINVNGTIRLLRELGKDAIADELIDFYIENRSDEPALFDLSQYAFAGDITDKKLRAKFEEKHQHNLPVVALEAAARTVGEGKGWSGADMLAMEAASEQEFYDLLKRIEGDQLRIIVKGCIRAGEVSKIQEVGARVRGALARIAKESDVNAIRVRRYIALEETVQEAQPAGAPIKKPNPIQ